MHTLTLTLTDQLYEQLIKFASQTNANVVAEQAIKDYLAKQTNTTTISKENNLAGMFAHYVTQPITDEDVQQAIAKGAFNRAMVGKTHDLYR